MSDLWLVHESDYDHHQIVAVFATEAEAIAERDYCTYTAGAVDLYPNQYSVSRMTLGESTAVLRVGFKPECDGHLLLPTETHLMTGTGQNSPLGTLQELDEPWDDGTLVHVWARSMGDAREVAADWWSKRRREARATMEEATGSADDDPSLSSPRRDEATTTT